MTSNKNKDIWMSTSSNLKSAVHFSFEKIPFSVIGTHPNWGRILKIKRRVSGGNRTTELSYWSHVTYQVATRATSFLSAPVFSESSFSLPLPHLLSLFLSSSSSPLCHSCWWKDRDSTGHRRWKPLLPERLSICSERQSGKNMHICLYIWNVLSLLYAMVLKFFWWGMMRALSLFTAISWRKKNFFHFFFHSPPCFDPL